MAIWYVYPKWHRVSFTLIAMKHVDYMRGKLHFDTVDELAFPHIVPSSTPLVLIHPYFFIMIRSSKFIARKLHLYRGFIGVEVCDSDHISPLAVGITDYAQRIIVPSTFCKQVYIESGVKVPVDVVPHGVDPNWYDEPPKVTDIVTDIIRLKRERGLKLILYFLWHSADRKGFPELFEFYRKLRKERKDVMLIVKTMSRDGRELKLLKMLGIINIYGWLSEAEKMSLYDVSDIYALFSRGGGFELNGLEALVRGVPVIAHGKGSWADYVPDFLRVPYKNRVVVLQDNPIHDGYGYTIDVEKAVDKACHILDNLDDYKARVREHAQKVLKNKFRWDLVADRLIEIVREEFNR